MTYCILTISLFELPFLTPNMQKNLAGSKGLSKLNYFRPKTSNFQEKKLVNKALNYVETYWFGKPDTAKFLQKYSSTTELAG